MREMQVSYRKNSHYQTIANPGNFTLAAFVGIFQVVKTFTTLTEIFVLFVSLWFSDSRE
jgi:hypothetical protein